VRNKWYFEVWNEPTWCIWVLTSTWSCTIIRQPGSNRRIRSSGWGAGRRGHQHDYRGREFQILLDHCRSGTNAATGKTGTAIDFLTYHWYANNSVPIGISGAVLEANNLAAMHRAVLDTLRKNYSWFKGPVFIDEVGPTSRTPLCRDLQSTASWLAKTIHLLNENGPAYLRRPCWRTGHSRICMRSSRINWTRSVSRRATTACFCGKGFVSQFLGHPETPVPGVSHAPPSG